MIRQNLFTATLIQGTLLAALLVLTASSAQAALLAYEPFDYTLGTRTPLIMLDGGAGWDGRWTGRASDADVPDMTTEIVEESNVSGPVGLTTVGNALRIDATTGTSQPGRNLSSFAISQLGGEGNTTWFSFIGRRDGEARDPNDPNGNTLPDNPYPRGANLALFAEVGVSPNDELLAVGNSSSSIDNTWSLIPSGSGGNREGAYDPPGGAPGGGPDVGNEGAATFPLNETQWAVVRIDHHDGMDDIYLWLSPDPAVEPSIANADAVILAGDTNNTDDIDLVGAVRAFTGAGRREGAADYEPATVLFLDEIRIGTTYADMSNTTVIPEPAGLRLLSIGGLAMLSRRRRKPRTTGLCL